MNSVSGAHQTSTSPLESPLQLEDIGGKPVLVDFDSAQISSDGGLLLLRQRIGQISYGYEDTNHSDELRSDPVFKMFAAHLPESDADLASQPTHSRFERTEPHEPPCIVLPKPLSRSSSVPTKVSLK